MAAASSGKRVASPCSQCNNLQRLNRSGHPWRLETRVSSLESSATSGCRFCELLLSGIDICMPAWKSEERAKSSVYESEAELPFKGLTLNLDWHESNGDRKQVAIDLFTLQPNMCPWTCIGVGSDICGDTSSEAAFARSFQWIRECQQTHALCNSRGSTPLPNRVVDVGDSDYPRIKLYETQNEPAKYICLSHCWGTAQLIRTTTATIHQYKEGISWVELSTTFQHAIIFARKLGIQYVWIDSLCIIQDSEDDWRAESSRMATIYENSHITLAATKSGSGAGGFFSAASLECKAHELRCNEDDGMSHPIYVRRNLHDDYKIGPNNNPLLRRGWVFQERLLSPRVLHFGAQELFWECMERAGCECSYISGSKEKESQKLSSVSEYLLRHMLGKISHAIKLSSESPQVLKNRWHEIVEEYSYLDLTFEKDKFPALSGVVKQMQRVRDAKYLAGLWEDNLVDDLLWSTFALSAGRPLRWRGPTWSWVSVNGRIQYVSNSDEVNRTFAKIIEVECTPLATDSTSELVSATIVVSSHMVTAVLRKNPNTNSAPSLLHRYALEAADGEHYGFQSDYTLPDDKHLGETVYCLWMRCGGSGNSYWHCDCIVLRCVDAAQQIYERLGMAWIAKYSHHLPQPLGKDQIPFNPGTECVTVRIR
ncbi:heterokaryon incompatibility protein-domain-containing protein [Xylaria sp. FL1777]|nr:heterokaryon incompatibility protein-domain-containing protein [Xylaria sp. FL1777]